MKRVWAYSRVSTPSQKPNLSKQTTFLRNYCKAKGYLVNGYGFEIGTGRYPSQLKELNKIIENVKPDETIVVRDITRIGRNYNETTKLINEVHRKYSVFYSILDDIDSRHFEFFKFVEFSEIELHLHLNRQKRRIAILKSQGAHLGRPPKGKNIVNVNGIPKVSKV